jgi:hypothetical protein
MVMVGCLHDDRAAVLEEGSEDRYMLDLDSIEAQ